MQVATYKKQILTNGRNVLDEKFLYKKDFNKPAIISASIKKGNIPMKKVIFHLDEKETKKKPKIQYTPHPHKKHHTHHRHHKLGEKSKRHTQKKH